MQQTFISLRSQTSTPIKDLIEEENLNCIHSINIIEILVGRLINLAEEGVALKPKIIFCQSISRIIKVFPGSIYYRIGEVTLNTSAVSEVLKNCAAICGEQWNIFVERLDDTKLSYGIFTYMELPGKLGLAKAVELCSEETCILIRKIDNNIIEISTSRGSSISVSFSTTRETGRDVTKTRHFVKYITQKCVPIGINPEDNVDLFRRYVNGLINRTLDQCHGTILVCCATNELQSIPGLKKFITLSPAINFYEIFVSYRNDQSAEIFLKLKSYEELLFGMSNNDGAILFSTDGSVLAYRAFYYDPGSLIQNGENGGMLTRPIVGGARRQAYEEIKSVVGEKIRACLFRSQDGQILTHGA